MYTADEPLSLINIGNGAAVQLVEKELERVIKDILDLNTEAKATREVNLKIIFKPDENREIITTGIKATSKLAGSRIFGTSVTCGQSGNRVEARELFSGQRPLFGEEEENGKVIPMTRKEE